MLRSMRNVLLVFLAVCMLLACAAGTAESIHEEIENPAFDMEVTVGYDGMMTYGKIMPVRVRIRNYGDDFEGLLAMNAHMNSKEYDRYEKAVAIPAGSQREFELYLTVSSRQNAFTAELVRDGEVVCAANGKPRTVINPSALLIGVLSTRPQNMKNLDITRDNDVLARYEYWNTIPLTQDTFPEELNALKSFGMLVLDDFDPAVLSEKQRCVLDTWLCNGRILLCGGGANAGRSTAYFSEYTGLTLEGITTADSVVKGLERLIGRKESGRQVSAAIAQYSGAEALGKDADGNGLIWRTEAGAGRIYTAAFEMGDPALNSENLMHYFWQQLLVAQDQDLYFSVIYADAGNDSGAYVSAGGTVPVKARSMLLPGMLVVAGMLVLACILWWLLKKKDLRQWMWLVLPALSVLTVASLMMMATGAETNRPLAVVAENLVQNGSGSIRNFSSVSVAAPFSGRHAYSMEGNNLQTTYYDYVDYEEDNDEIKEPTTMRTCYTSGGTRTVTVNSITPWQVVNLVVEPDAHIQGRIDGEIWMEEDGFHGEIVNETDVKLTAGHVITTYGYVSVPELAPGEKTGFVMKKGAFANAQDPEYKDGFMYPESPGMYQVTYSALGYTDEMTWSSKPEDIETGVAVNMINNAAEQLRREQGNTSYGVYESAMFVYSAKPESRETPELEVDGKPVEKKANAVNLTAELRFQAMGRTGVIYRSAGMDIPDKMETDENLLPTDVITPGGKTTYYFPLSENPTFRFTMDGLEGVRIKSLQVIQNSYYVNQASAYALNILKHEWEEIPVNEDIRNPERYLDEKGRLYVQFRLNGQEMYADISTPLINLEGRTEHAEN